MEVYMSTNGAGAPLDTEAPTVNKKVSVASDNFNNSVFERKRKSLEKTLSDNWPNKNLRLQLEEYLSLGLVPIPLKGKIPIVKWRSGNWNPKTIDDLASYKGCLNWGVKTSSHFAVLDFDTQDSFIRFITANIDRLPEGLPLVRTGRGYHLWFTSVKPLRDQHYEGIDIKAEGGQVVAPPSIHPKTHRPYKFLWKPGDDVPELNLDNLDISIGKEDYK
jgi:hypothetical protein